MTEKNNKTNKKSFVVARQKDGSFQITFTIPWEKISEEKKKAVIEMAASVEVPGFRKGKAPLDKVEERLDSQFILEKALAKILPKMFSKAIDEEKLRPAMYPKFELIKAKEGEDWQVRAISAELPNFNLGDYKKFLTENSQTSIWTPGSPKQEKKVELTTEQKESAVLKALDEKHNFEIPEILIEEEVNSRLSSLLSRIEKLGLSLESYLASIKKTAKELRREYSEEAKRAIKLDIILGAIAKKEDIKVSEEEVDDFVKMAKASNQKISNDQKSTIKSFLIKRKVIEKLASLL